MNRFFRNKILKKEYLEIYDYIGIFIITVLIIIGTFRLLGGYELFLPNKSDFEETTLTADMAYVDKMIAIENEIDKNYYVAIGTNPLTQEDFRAYSDDNLMGLMDVIHLLITELKYELEKEDYVPIHFQRYHELVIEKTSLRLDLIDSYIDDTSNYKVLGSMTNKEYGEYATEKYKDKLVNINKKRIDTKKKFKTGMENQFKEKELVNNANR